MKKTLLCALTALLFFSCGEKKEQETSPFKRSGKTVVALSGQKALDEYIGSPDLTVVDMYADWCGPCKRLAPILKDLSKEYGDKVSFVKVDVDKNRRLAQKYRANSIPLVLFFKNGSVVDRMEGFGGRPPLEEKIKNNMK